METTEKVVEAYVRYVRHWATIPNIRCAGQYEIDLIAIDPTGDDRYHIETSVSGSQAFAKLTAKPFDPEDLKQRVKISGSRRTLGYFTERKFAAPEVVERLRDYGFAPGNYSKVIVTWGWTDDAAILAKEQGVELWDFRTLMQEIAETIRHQRSYFTDDTLRTLNLFVRAVGEAATPRRGTNVGDADTLDARTDDEAPYWVYQNRIRGRARLHRRGCRHVAKAARDHGLATSEVDGWTPFDERDRAEAFVQSLGYGDAGQCADCE